MKNSRRKDDPWRGLFLTTAIGVDLTACLAGGYFLGKWVGERVGQPMLYSVIGFIVGLATGIVSVIYLIRQVTGDDHE